MAGKVRKECEISYARKTGLRSAFFLTVPKFRGVQHPSGRVRRVLLGYLLLFISFRPLPVVYVSFLSPVSFSVSVLSTSPYFFLPLHLCPLSSFLVSPCPRLRPIYPALSLSPPSLSPSPSLSSVPSTCDNHLASLT